MAITKRTITNINDPLTAQDGTALVGIEITFLLVNEHGNPTDAWDVVTGERIAPIKEVATTDVNGEFSVSLWPNDRGSSDNPTYYRCTTKSRDVRAFTAALPSGTLQPITWIDFASYTTPITSETFGTPLILVAGDTIPVSAGIIDKDGNPTDITGYTITLEVTNSSNVMVEYPAIITFATDGLYNIDLSALIIGRYFARLKITNAALQVEHSQSFIIEVGA